MINTRFFRCKTFSIPYTTLHTLHFVLKVCRVVQGCAGLVQTFASVFSLGEVCRD